MNIVHLPIKPNEETTARANTIRMITSRTLLRCTKTQHSSNYNDKFSSSFATTLSSSDFCTARTALKYSTAHLRPPTNMFGCNNTKYTYCICYGVSKLVNLKLAWDFVGFNNRLSDGLFARAP